MFHGSPDHRHKHHYHPRQYQVFDESNGQPVYVTIPEQMPMPFPEGQLSQYGTPVTNNNYNDQYVPAEEAWRVRVVGYEPARHVPVPSSNKTNNKKKVEENVDAEAEEFIQYEHKKFQLSKMMSELPG